MSLPEAAVAPARRLVTAALAGFGAGAIALLALTVDGDVRTATETTFAVGALALGFGVVGWSGSVLAGRGIENMQRYLETDTSWTEADSRRAMTRIAGFGAGVMLVASLGTAFL